MPDARAGNDRQEAVEKTGPRAQDRHEHELLAVDELGIHGLQRRLDLDLVHRHVAGDFVGHQQPDLAHEPPEARGAGLLLAQQRELVLHEGMVDHVNVMRHAVCSHALWSSLSCALSALLSGPIEFRRPFRRCRSKAEGFRRAAPRRARVRPPKCRLRGCMPAAARERRGARGFAAPVHRSKPPSAPATR